MGAQPSGPAPTSSQPGWLEVTTLADVTVDDGSILSVTVPVTDVDNIGCLAVVDLDVGITASDLVLHVEGVATADSESVYLVAIEVTCKYFVTELAVEELFFSVSTDEGIVSEEGLSRAGP